MLQGISIVFSLWCAHSFILQQVKPLELLIVLSNRTHQSDFSNAYYNICVCNSVGMYFIIIIVNSLVSNLIISLASSLIKLSLLSPTLSSFQTQLSPNLIKSPFFIFQSRQIFSLRSSSSFQTQATPRKSQVSSSLQTSVIITVYNQTTQWSLQA